MDIRRTSIMKCKEILEQLKRYGAVEVWTNGIWSGGLEIWDNGALHIYASNDCIKYF